MASTTRRELSDRANGAIRFVRALGNDPGEWDLPDLDYLASLEDAITQIRGRVVTGLRESGFTDKQIGEQLGVTQQAVSKRWPGGGRYVGAAGRHRKMVTH